MVTAPSTGSAAAVTRAHVITYARVIRAGELTLQLLYECGNRGSSPVGLFLCGGQCTRECKLPRRSCSPSRRCSSRDSGSAGSPAGRTPHRRDHLQGGDQGLPGVRDASEGLASLEELLQHRLEPDVITYTSVIGAGEQTLQF